MVNHKNFDLASSLTLYYSSCSSALTFEYLLLVSFGEAETISLELLETGRTFALDIVGWDFADLVLLAVNSLGLKAPCFAKPLTGPVHDPVGVRATLLLAC